MALWQRRTHEISEQVHVVFLDPVAKDLGRSVPLGENELYQLAVLQLGRRLGLQTAILIGSCMKKKY